MNTPTTSRPIADDRTSSELRQLLDIAFAQHRGPVPAAVYTELLAYLTTGTPTGLFLRAVISNDLANSVRRAGESFALIRPLVGFLYNHAHPDSWGSPEAYAAWTSPAYSTKSAAPTSFSDKGQNYPKAAIPPPPEPPELASSTNTQLWKAELLDHFLRSSIQAAFDNEEAFLHHFFPTLHTVEPSLEEFYMASERCCVVLAIPEDDRYPTTIPTQDYLTWVESL